MMITLFDGDLLAYLIKGWIDTSVKWLFPISISIKVLLLAKTTFSILNETSSIPQLLRHKWEMILLFNKVSLIP